MVRRCARSFKRQLPREDKSAVAQVDAGSVGRLRVIDAQLRSCACACHPPVHTFRSSVGEYRTPTQRVRTARGRSEGERYGNGSGRGFRASMLCLRSCESSSWMALSSLVLMWRVEPAALPPSNEQRGAAVGKPAALSARSMEKSYRSVQSVSVSSDSSLQVDSRSQSGCDELLRSLVESTSGEMVRFSNTDDQKY